MNNETLNATVERLIRLDNLRERLKKVPVEVQLARVFDRLEHYHAFLPYFPLMLDFSIKENEPESDKEIVEYLASFPTEPK